MEPEILAIGIENEFEGDQPLWLDLAKPEMLANYIVSNIEIGEKKEFTLKRFSKEEFAALD